MFQNQETMQGGSNMKLGLDKIREEDDFIEVEGFSLNG